jgi:hypothetical protein
MNNCYIRKYRLIYFYYGNAIEFVEHPEWVEAIKRPLTNAKA